MNPDTILAPVGVLAALTFFVLLFVPALRFARRGRTDEEMTPTGDIPGGTSNPNFADLLEMPVLFYVVCLMALVARRVDELMLTLAWAYVVVRLVHSGVHLTYDNPRHRTFLFAVSNFVVLAMWIFFFFPPGGR